MNDINRNLPPPTQVPFGGAWGDKVPEAKHREEAAGRAEPLDLALVEHYLACSRKTAQVTIDSTHLAQLCNEVWRRRRAERDDRSVGVAELARQERANNLALMATKAIANVGHSRPFEGHQHEATAIVLVANMLAELMQWRSGERVSAELEGYRQRQTTDHTILLDGGPVHGSKEAVDYARKLVDELMAWRRGLRTPSNLGARDLIPGGMTVRGSTEAIDHLNKMLAELESARRIIEELERMGWLMKAAKP